MPHYLVKAPCVYTTADGAATHHREAAVGVTVVELDEETAAALGDAVQPLVTGPVPDLVQATPFPDEQRSDAVRKAAAKAAVAASEKTGRKVDPQVEKLATEDTDG
jgi:hypothetical protein